MSTGADSSHHHDGPTQKTTQLVDEEDIYVRSYSRFSAPNKCQNEAGPPHGEAWPAARQDHTAARPAVRTRSGMPAAAAQVGRH